MVGGATTMHGPRPQAHFRVWIDGDELALSSVTAFAGEVLAGADRADVADQADGPAPQRVVLTRAVQGDRRLFDWYAAAQHGKAATRLIEIALLDGPGGRVLDQWQLLNATPRRWTGPRFDGLGSGIAEESLTVHFTEIRWVTP
ncbi:MAG: phage tail protein [Pseudomonadota bacterium]